MPKAAHTRREGLQAALCFQIFLFGGKISALKKLAAKICVIYKKFRSGLWMNKKVGLGLKLPPLGPSVAQDFVGAPALQRDRPDCSEKPEQMGRMAVSDWKIILPCARMWVVEPPCGAPFGRLVAKSGTKLG
jgi:hypothetical protein